jgi:ketol-acid reductoisomerase
MYAYRSAIAHGVKLDFTKKLALLKNADVANALVIDAVKKSIRQAYVEPRLMKDLHDV